jgi:hypothetical protein
MKIVKESISFERGIDPKVSLGIGKYYLIKQWIDKVINQGLFINNYKINKDETIDASYVDISYEYLPILPDFIKFGKVEDNFCCCFETKESLNALPHYIGGYARFYYGKNHKREFSKTDIKERCVVIGGIDLLNH